MTTWVVDDGPLGILALEIDPGWSWPAATLHVLEAVVRGAGNDKSDRRGQLLAMEQAGSRVIAQHAVNVGSTAETYLASHLRVSTTSATADLGEHESIAWMLYDGPDNAVFVTTDKRAAYLALCELGPPRVASPFDLWADLRARSLITDTQFQGLCRRMNDAYNFALPGRLQMP